MKHISLVILFIEYFASYCTIILTLVCLKLFSDYYILKSMKNHLTNVTITFIIINFQNRYNFLSIYISSNSTNPQCFALLSFFEFGIGILISFEVVSTTTVHIRAKLFCIQQCLRYPVNTKKPLLHFYSSPQNTIFQWV
jgi:hypothetical protein